MRSNLSIERALPALKHLAARKPISGWKVSSHLAGLSDIRTTDFTFLPFPQGHHFLQSKIYDHSYIPLPSGDLTYQSVPSEGDIPKMASFASHSYILLGLPLSWWTRSVQETVPEPYLVSRCENITNQE